jgi:hypothetical protein
VPAPVRLVLDAVFVAALVTPHPRASTSIRDLPTTAVAHVVALPANSPGATPTPHGPVQRQSSSRSDRTRLPRRPTPFARATPSPLSQPRSAAPPTRGP